MNTRTRLYHWPHLYGGLGVARPQLRRRFTFGRWRGGGARATKAWATTVKIRNQTAILAAKFETHLTRPSRRPVPFDTRSKSTCIRVDSALR